LFGGSRGNFSKPPQPGRTVGDAETNSYQLPPSQFQCSDCFSSEQQELLRLDAIEVQFSRRHSEQFGQQMGQGCVEKLIFDLCVAVIAIAELISCTAS
jgi:hypothetical protein